MVMNLRPRREKQTGKRHCGGGGSDAIASFSHFVSSLRTGLLFALCFKIKFFFVRPFDELARIPFVTRSRILCECGDGDSIVFTLEAERRELIIQELKMKRMAATKFSANFDSQSTHTHSTEHWLRDTTSTMKNECTINAMKQEKYAFFHSRSFCVIPS